MENDDLILSAGDVCTILKLKESTLRKYALILQDVGYHFQTNGKGQRAYYNRDVIAIKKLIEIKQAPDMTLEQSANAVISWVKNSNMSLSVIDEERHTEQHNADLKELKSIVENQNTMINQQNILLQELMKKMDTQQKYIDEKLEQRDKILLESIRESQEVKKQMLQIAAAAEEEKKKGFFARLFGK